MDDCHRALLNKHLVKFSQDLLLDEVVLVLLSNRVIQPVHAEKIKAAKDKDGSQLARAELISILQRCGPKAFDAFCAALSETKQFELLKLLKPDFAAAIAGCEPAPPIPGTLTGRLSDVSISFTPVQSDEDDDDGNCISEPKQKEIDANEEYYSAEKFAFADVKETEGILTNLKVPPTKQMPTHDFNSHEVYPHFSFPKGYALIMNNRDFTGPKNDPLPQRCGTDVDAQNMKHLLQSLGYAVSLKHNLPGQAMLNEMLRFALKDHSQCASAVVVIFSHGQNGGIYGVDGDLIGVDRFVTIMNAQNCKSLHSKPKLFFLQACRGGRVYRLVLTAATNLASEKYDGGAHVTDGRLEIVRNGVGSATCARAMSVEEQRVETKLQLVSLDATDAKAIKHKIPSEQDILICFATTPGYVSWRNSAKGSWFIQAVCQIFAEYARDEDILTMLTRVNNRVANAFMSNDGYKQIPSLCSQLTRKFYFYPGIYGDLNGTTFTSRSPVIGKNN